MAHVFRPEYTRDVPPHAERCTYRGKSAVKWKARGGKVLVGVLTDRPGRCRVESPTWHVAYDGPNGEPLVAKGYADRAATDALMTSLVQRSAHISSGLLPPEAARPRLTLTELLDKWHRYVAAGRATAKGAARQLQRATDICDGVGATRPAHLTPSAVRDWVAARRKENRHKLKPFGAGTAGNYVQAVKAFTRWLAVVDRSEPVDHLSALRKEADPTDVRRERRALDPGQLDALLAATAKSREAVYGLTGTERHALYLLASTTGLRADELASLTPASFGRASVAISAKRAKNRKADELPVPAAVMKVVRVLFRKPGDPVWPNRGRPSQAWWLVGARMLRHDLAAAGIPATVAGRVFDFHSLRGQFATDLDRKGVTLTRAQRLMRHSTPVLTAKHYTKPETKELAAEVDKLGRGRRGR